MKIAINGFGRIGKTFLRTLLSDKDASKKITVETINIGHEYKDLTAKLFKYDSIMGKFQGEVEYNNGSLIIDNHKIKIISELEPKNIHWNDIDWVIEATGHFTNNADIHIQSGAKKVLITAPSDNKDITIIPGVNGSDYSPGKHRIVSLGSCTTNCFAPMIKVIKENFQLHHGLMTTVHAYTNDQVLLDVEHKDPRRARAAARNIIPTKTGANKVIADIFPELKGSISASAIRVPNDIVSIVDFTFKTEEILSAENINSCFEKAAATSLKDVLEYTNEELVSSDFIGNPHSCIIDAKLTKVIGNMGKVFGWYDNEWGYSQRLKDFLLHNL